MEGAVVAMKPAYKRVLIKLSGEALGKDGKGFEPATIESVASRVIALAKMGVQVALVVGAGNIWRGREGASSDMNRVTADYMGMLATVINALAIQDAVERLGRGALENGKDVEVRVQTAIEMRQIAEPFIQRRAVHQLEKGNVVIFACGTGSPFFTTDTAAALRATEIGAQALLLAKNTDYIYDADPRIVKDAKKLTDITYMEVLERGLTVMDSTALTLCMDNKMPILCFGLKDPDNLIRAVCGERVGTYVGPHR